MAGATILLIGDETRHIEWMSSVLSQAGFRAIPCRPDQDPYEAVRAHAPDLIILDIRMDGLGGVGMSVLEELRMDARTAHLPVLCITGGPSLHLQQELLEEFRCDALPEPFEPGHLIRQVAVALGGRGACPR